MFHMESPSVLRGREPLSATQSVHLYGLPYALGTRADDTLLHVFLLVHDFAVRDTAAGIGTTGTR
jgi:hypothetical protein